MSCFRRNKQRAIPSTFNPEFRIAQLTWRTNPTHRGSKSHLMRDESASKWKQQLGSMSRPRSGEQLWPKRGLSGGRWQFPRHTAQLGRQSRGRAEPGGAWLAVREPGCQLACHSTPGFKGAMTFSTVSGQIPWWWKAEVSVLVLK